MKLKTCCLAALLGAVAATAAPQTSLEAPKNQVALGDFGIAQPRIDGPIDNRFFGTYCQAEPEEFCKSVDYLPDPCATVDGFRLHIDHLATPQGSRLLGLGSFRVDGKPATVSVAGTVLRRRAAGFAAHAPGLGSQRGTANLTLDGLGLNVLVAGERLDLRKDACGNAAPAVVLNVVGGPNFDFREAVTFSSGITDEDDTFPLDRLVFSSDRQGELGGGRFVDGTTLITSQLQPGAHRISLTVIDSGGLVGSDSREITIVNRPPEVTIRQPDQGSTVLATAPVLLQGVAYDPEDRRNLIAGALRWDIEVEPGAGFELAGFGEIVTVAFPEPADPARVRLVATDSAGAQATAITTLNVAPFDGNAPPIVAIQKPEKLLPGGQFTLVEIAGNTLAFEAIAADLEDSLDELTLRWEFASLIGDQIDPNPTVAVPAPVDGVLATEVVLVGFGGYRATFTARDSEGAETSRSVDLFVLSEPEP